MLRVKTKTNEKLLFFLRRYFTWKHIKSLKTWSLGSYSLLMMDEVYRSKCKHVIQEYFILHFLGMSAVLILLFCFIPPNTLLFSFAGGGREIKAKCVSRI